ncbi:MAG: glycoside hydrolase family 127 protein, partial [Mycobacterium sp.]|nr:glycoside hydrolase family 127 protein [Mycobacterium sp.]
MTIESPASQVLPLGDVRPTGWLRTQLELQAAGMAGHLDEFWPDIADSAWIGGAAEGWERAPYWLDALVPLAVLLDDERLLGKVARWIDYVVDHQASDGWMGPRRTDPSSHDPYDVWPRMVLLKVLLQHHSRFADDRVLQAALRLSRRIDEVLAQWPLREWGRVRWADLVYSLDRLYELTGQTWLLDTAEQVQKQGYDWSGYTPSRHKVTDEELQQFRATAGDVWMNDAYLSTHGVNVAMGLKAFPIWSRRGEQRWARPAFDRLLAQLDEFHGQPTGLFSADEHLAGTSPAQGTETCAVVEYLFSLATALEIWSPDEGLVERWERIAFNALPASARPDECGHQ